MLYIRRKTNSEKIKYSMIFIIYQHKNNLFTYTVPCFFSQCLIQKIDEYFMFSFQFELFWTAKKNLVGNLACTEQLKLFKFEFIPLSNSSNNNFKCENA